MPIQGLCLVSAYTELKKIKKIKKIKFARLAGWLKTVGSTRETKHFRCISYSLASQAGPRI